MGKKETRRDKKAEKRTRIINSSIALFAQKGFNDTSMLEIARKSDVAEGTVYEYFSNKENLLISIPKEKLALLYDNLSGNTHHKRIKKLLFYKHK